MEQLDAEGDQRLLVPKQPDELLAQHDAGDPHEEDE
jgi:hypothetical protein